VHPSRPHPPESHRRAVELARERAKPIAKIGGELAISASCLRNWLHQADVDEQAVDLPAHEHGRR
jgi:transposase-like protein